MKQRVTWEVVAAVIVSVKLSALTTYAPIVIGSPPVRAPWLVAMISGGAALLLALFASLLADRFGRADLVTAACGTLGKVCGRLLAAVAGLLFTYVAATDLRQLAEFVGDTALRRTPIWVLMAVFLLVVLRAVRAGLVTTGRLSKLTAVAVVAAMLVLTVLASNHIDLRRLRPILEGGIMPVLHQAATPFGVFGEAAWIALLFYPLVRSPAELRKGIVVGVAVNIVIVGLGGTLLIALFGPAVVSRLMYPTYSAVESIQIGRYLQRLEWTMVVLWVGTVYVKVTVLLCGATRCWGGALGMPRSAPLALPAGVAALVGGLYIYHDALDVWQGFSPARFLPPELALEVGIPAVLLLVAAIRGRRRAAAPDDVPAVGAGPGASPP